MNTTTDRELVTSDSHYRHKNIVRYCNRPENHDEVMVAGWNDVVRPEGDVVYHLGDFAFTKSHTEAKSILDELNGRKQLLLGNHDRHTRAWYMGAGFEAVHKSDIVLARRGLTVVLSHYPVETPLLQKFRLPNTLKVVNVHGHVHNSEDWIYNPDGVHVNVSVEVTDYKPVVLHDLLEPFTR